MPKAAMASAMRGLLVRMLLETASGPEIAKDVSTL